MSPVQQHREGRPTSRPNRAKRFSVALVLASVVLVFIIGLIGGFGPLILAYLAITLAFMSGAFIDLWIQQSDTEDTP